MFKKKDEKTEFEMRVRELQSDNRIAMKEMEKDYELKLKEKEFEIRHHKDEEIKQLDNEIVILKRTNAEQIVKIKMLDKIVDLNADIIDVKNLVIKLIDKLPQIDLKSLTINQRDK